MKIKTLTTLVVIALGTLFMQGCGSTSDVVEDRTGLKTYTQNANGDSVLAAEFFFDGTKDKIVESAELDPSTGKFTLKGYTSTANAAAVEGAKQEAIQNAQTRQFMFETVGSVLDMSTRMAAQSQGIPIPPATLPVPPQAVPTPADASSAGGAE